MKRILMVSCEGLGNGGVQAVIMSIVRNLSHEFVFDILLFTNEKRYYEDEFLKYGGNIYRIPRYEGKNKIRRKSDYYIRGGYMYRNILQLLQRQRYDAIHCHDEFENAVILKAAAKANIPVRISHTHIISKKSNVIADFLENYRRSCIEKYATCKIGCSREACNAFYKDKSNCIVINNAFDEKRFNKNLYKQNERNEFCLVQVGSFNPTKNQVFSIEVIEEIIKVYPNAKLILIGFPMGNYQTHIDSLIEEKNLQENVVFMESNANIPMILNNASGFIFPSVREGFGIVLIEAQAMGVKCYSSDVVPKLTDCGGVEYLSLEKGAKVWADAIILDYEKNKGAHEEYDVSKFTTEYVIQYYKGLYKGDIS